ncbi:MAG: tRNA dihydrouridine synthase DusB [Candidatus Omnitrophica bacterium]|nr:tRNA dihydrouridine synthase DusB [Candidatus Omnitrophota bacterium]
MNEPRTTKNEKRKTNDGISKMLSARLIMAPMAGVTDGPFRLMVRRHGCLFAFTEMIDSTGLVYRSKKTLDMLDHPPEDSPLGVQISGNDPDKVLYTALICEEKGFDVIDLNAGCPAPKVVKGGKGAALLKEPSKIAAIVRKLATKLKTPVTVKMRIGWDDSSMNYVEVAKAAEGEGARAICVHPRTREQMYKGSVDHGIVGEVKSFVKVPVFASGNIFSPEDAEKALSLTGCDGVFMARGALGRPWIFRETYERLNGDKAEYVPSLEELKTAMIEHFELSFGEFGFERARPRMYKNICWYLKRYKGLNEIMKEYTRLGDIDAFRAFVSRLVPGNGKYLVLA